MLMVNILHNITHTPFCYVRRLGNTGLIARNKRNAIIRVISSTSPESPEQVQYVQYQYVSTLQIAREERPSCLSSRGKNASVLYVLDAI